MKIKIKNKSIIFECDNNQIVQKVAQLVKDAIALTDDVPEFEEVKEPKNNPWRPSPSCFDDKEQEDNFKEILRDLKQKLVNCKYSINTLGAYISFRTIDRYKNQKYFCHLLNDAGIEVNYPIFMRELEKMHQNKGDLVIKVGQYFNHFNNIFDTK